MRREYTMFFAVNMVGLLIQSAGTGLLKYGLGMSERPHRLAFNITTIVCICVATLFRFWTYRTFVFKDAPATPSTSTESVAIVAPAEGAPVPVPGYRDPIADDNQASEAELTQFAAAPADGSARTH
jgi:hypothetical protein